MPEIAKQRGVLFVSMDASVCVCILFKKKNSHIRDIWKSFASPSKGILGKRTGASVSFSAEKDEGKKRQGLLVMINVNNKIRARCRLS